MTKDDLLKEFEESVRWQRRIRYHEAGHGVALYIHKFRPKMIDDDACELTGARWLNRDLRTCRARERAADLAVCCIAGIVAESKACCLSMHDLRRSTGRLDYERVETLARKTAFWLKGWEKSDAVIQAQIALWEARTLTLFDQSTVWRSVECVVAELDNDDGFLGGSNLIQAIKRGLSSAEPSSEFFDMPLVVPLS